MAFYPDVIFLIILNQLMIFQFIVNKKGSRYAPIDYIGFFKASVGKLK